MFWTFSLLTRGTVRRSGVMVVPPHPCVPKYTTPISAVLDTFSLSRQNYKFVNPDSVFDDSSKATVVHSCTIGCRTLQIRAGLRLENKTKTNYIFFV